MAAFDEEYLPYAERTEPASSAYMQELNEPFSFFYYIIFIYTIFFKNFILNIIFGNISLGQAVLNICFILNPFFAIIFNIIFN